MSGKSTVFTKKQRREQLEYTAKMCGWGGITDESMVRMALLAPGDILGKVTEKEVQEALNVWRRTLRVPS